MSAPSRRWRGRWLWLALAAAAAVIALAPFGLGRLIADLWIGAMGVVLGLLGAIWGH